MAEKKEIQPEDKVLICVPWSYDSFIRLSDHGVMVDSCFFCGASVLTSPEGMEMLERVGLKIACVECVKDDPHSETAHPEVSQEMREKVREVTGQDPETILQMMGISTSRELAELLSRLHQQRHSS